MSTTAFTHPSQIILSNGDVAVNSADAYGRVPNWLIKIGRESSVFLF